MANQVERMTPTEREVARECLDLCEHVRAFVSYHANALGVPEFLLWRMVRDLAVKHDRETH
jgi:hypothetical protein